LGLEQTNISADSVEKTLSGDAVLTPDGKKEKIPTRGRPAARRMQKRGKPT
jgi:hypothetical protein